MQLEQATQLMENKLKRKAVIATVLVTVGHVAAFFAISTIKDKYNASKSVAPTPTALVEVNSKSTTDTVTDLPSSAAATSATTEQGSEADSAAQTTVQQELKVIDVGDESMAIQVAPANQKATQINSQANNQMNYQANRWSQTNTAKVPASNHKTKPVTAYYGYTSNPQAYTSSQNTAQHQMPPVLTKDISVRANNTVLADAVLNSMDKSTNKAKQSTVVHTDAPTKSSNGSSNNAIPHQTSPANIEQ
ncbi:MULTISPECIES: hypothetical protein [unclassified Acinetobacter]|uniref:hypothetical protein n=1 Tax=unclassified Acinetobacter TaxID=196816 RepID=UPI0035BA38F2